MGGRIFNDTPRHMNYGAVFYFGSYRMMLSKQRDILKPTTDVVPSLTAAACNPDDTRQWSALSAKTASDLPSLWRFERFMTQEFLPHYEIIGKKHWPQAMFTGPTEALPQNLAPGLIMAGDHNGLGMEPAAISGIYAANKVLGRTIDDDPTVRVSVSADPYLEPAGAKGMQATLEPYGAVAADAGKSAAKVVSDNKTAFLAGAVAAAAACCALLLRRRK